MSGIAQTAVAVDLLRFVYTYQATEKQHQQAAEKMLRQAGVKIEGGEGKRPLADVITAVLYWPKSSISSQTDLQNGRIEYLSVP